MKGLWEKILMPYLFKHPTMLLLLAIMIVWGVWGYYDVLAKVEKNNTQMQGDLAFIKGELKGMALFFTGEDSFNGDHEVLPPKEYLIGIDTEILNNDFDSCKQSVVVDSVTGRPCWYCWAEERLFTFK